MLDSTTTKDTFNMKKTSSQMPALGYHFGPDNKCVCGEHARAHPATLDPD